MVPAPLKRVARSMQGHARELLRAQRLGDCVARLRDGARAGKSVDPGLLHDCWQAWGNHAWSADLGYVEAVAARASGNAGVMLDCGSGLSTLIAATLCEPTGGRVWSLEQDAEWHAGMKRWLDRLEIDNVTLVHAPLREFGDYVWFDVDGATIPRHVSNVFCDGPSVLPEFWPEPYHTSWRRGVVPVLARIGSVFDEILLDDADDPRFPALRDAWIDAGLDTEVIETASGPYLLARP